ncbi:MAG TPA: response regulator transcription factor [Bacilli bacterium]|nr:response regulator transcription factor [Bacilli bacterium]
MIKNCVLIVEDEEGIRKLVQLYLEKKGYRVLATDNGLEALEIVKAQQPDVILLDIEMPGMNGFEVCEQIRRRSKAVILFVSCKKELTDKIKGLSLGGDDYITKPFDFEELEARIQAMLRRNEWLTNEKQGQAILSYGDLHLHIDRGELFIGNEQIKLLNKEFQILLLMAKHPNRVWSSEQLYDQIWGYYGDGSVETVKVHISNLRRKVEKNPADPKYIQTVRGFGYKFVTA